MSLLNSILHLVSQHCSTLIASFTRMNPVGMSSCAASHHPIRSTLGGGGSLMSRLSRPPPPVAAIAQTTVHSRLGGGTGGGANGHRRKTSNSIQHRLGSAAASASASGAGAGGRQVAISQVIHISQYQLWHKLLNNSIGKKNIS